MPRTEPYAADSPLADPAFRVERARKASAAAGSPASLIRRLAKHAEDLTDEERGQLAAILATPRRAK